MELVLVLLLLYGLQCTLRLARGDVLFLRPLFTWHITAGPGWKPLHPVPSGPCWLASRLPLTEDEAGLCAREAPTRIGSAPLRRSPPRFDPADRVAIAARGKTVRLGRAVFLRATTRRAAEAAAKLLGDLQGKSPGDVRERIARELFESLSLASYREESERLHRASRLLAWSSDLYAALLCVGLPLLVWREHAERALFVAFPVLLAAHLLTLGALVVAHRRLFPGRSGDLLEQLAACAIYPPGLLGALQDLKQRILGRFHPAAVAVARLPQPERERFLRSELGRLAREAATDPRGPAALGLADLEREALEALIRSCGELREALLAPPTREDPNALSYCPICLGDYRVVAGTCGDCGVALAPYAR